jgi:hypothetical protein
MNRVILKKRAGRRDGCWHLCGRLNTMVELQCWNCSAGANVLNSWSSSPTGRGTIPTADLRTLTAGAGLLSKCSLKHSGSICNPALTKQNPTAIQATPPREGCMSRRQAALHRLKYGGKKFL